MKLSLMPKRSVPVVVCVMHTAPGYTSLCECLSNAIDSKSIVYSDIPYEIAIDWDEDEHPNSLEFYINGEHLEYSVISEEENNMQISFSADSYSSGYIFRDCYGFVQLEVSCQFINGPETSYWTDYLGVMLRANKTNEAISRMAEYVYQRHARYMWKRNILPTGAVQMVESSEKSLDSQIELIRSVAVIYEHNMVFFREIPHSIQSPRNMVK